MHITDAIYKPTCTHLQGGGHAGTGAMRIGTDGARGRLYMCACAPAAAWGGAVAGGGLRQTPLRMARRARSKPPRAWLRWLQCPVLCGACPGDSPWGSRHLNTAHSDIDTYGLLDDYGFQAHQGACSTAALIGDRAYSKLLR